MLKNKLKVAMIVIALLLPGLSQASWQHAKRTHRTHPVIHQPKYLKATTFHWRRP